jgi:hypothetical protein
MKKPTPGAADMAESHRHAIQALAEHSRSPFELVESLYRSELIKLEPGARITQYLPLVTSRRVRDRLRQSVHGAATQGVPPTGREPPGQAFRLLREPLASS